MLSAHRQFFGSGGRNFWPIFNAFIFGHWFCFQKKAPFLLGFWGRFYTKKIIPILVFLFPTFDVLAGEALTVMNLTVFFPFESLVITLILTGLLVLNSSGFFFMSSGNFVKWNSLSAVYEEAKLIVYKSLNYSKEIVDHWTSNSI